MTENEFKNSIKKVSSSRKSKITNSMGTYDIYKIIRRNKWKLTDGPVSELLFYKVIRSVNTVIADAIIKGYEVKLPCQMGTLELRKNTKKIKIKDGKLITNLPIDWNATLSLWYKDEESKRNKTLVRVTNNDIFKVLYNKSKATYVNLNFYSFLLNRNIKLKIKQRALLGDLDACLIY